MVCDNQIQIYTNIEIMQSYVPWTNVLYNVVVNSQWNNKNQDVVSSSIYYSQKYFQIKTLTLECKGLGIKIQDIPQGSQYHTVVHQCYYIMATLNEY